MGDAGQFRRVVARENSMKNIMNKVFGFVWMLAAGMSGVASLSAAPERPNIVFIMADDMGYGDVQALNPRSTIATPHLDRLAREGMSFTDAHSGSAVCTPTRYGVLTGRYCWRGSLKRGVLNGNGKPLIEPGRETVASFLRGHGYHTACVGKWHLGLGFVREEGGGPQDFDYQKPLTDGPHTRGFDHSYIIPASLDFPPYVYIENGSVTGVPDRTQPAQPFPAFLRKGPIGSDFEMENCPDRLLEETTDYLESRRGSEDPFFLYFPLTAPHKPVWPHPRFHGQSGLGPYGDFIVQVDATVGGVLEALDATGLADSTLVIYTSDNGSFMYREEEEGAPDHLDDPAVQAYRPQHHRANGRWRGTKADVWEAGHRVPFLARWPGRIAPGTRHDEAVCHVDLFATCAELVGAELPETAAEDSFSWLPAMLGRPVPPRAPVINHSASGVFAIRSGPWKLVLGSGSGGREKPKGQPFEMPYSLWNLDADPGETRNLIEHYPDIARKMERACLRLRDSGRSR